MSNDSAAIMNQIWENSEERPFIIREGGQRKGKSSVIRLSIAAERIYQNALKQMHSREIPPEQIAHSINSQLLMLELPIGGK